MRGVHRQADVVIVGGGIVGISTAYHLKLADRGLQVVVLDKGLLAEGSTGLSVGGFRQQFSLAANIRLSQESLRQMELAMRQAPDAIQLHRIGYLFVTSEATTWRGMLESAALQMRCGVAVEVLDQAAIKQRWPYLRTTDLAGGIFGPRDGYTDPYQVAMVFARAGREMGVCFKERSEVGGIGIRGDRIASVRSREGNISCGALVNAAGPWAGRVAEMAGLSIPVLPYRRQVFSLRTDDLLPRPVPMVIDLDRRFYFRGDGEGVLTGMSDLNEPSSFNTHVDLDFRDRVVEQLLHRVPGLGQARIHRSWAGLYAVTPDENPIIGFLGGPKGFWGAMGFSGHGFQHGPAAGKILSELILSGQTTFDLTPFRYDRFEGHTPNPEKRAV